MSMDKSLRIRRGATSTRSVLTRVERLARLTEAERWKQGDSPLGLPKVRVYKLSMKKKKKAKEEEGGDAAAAPAAGGKGAAAKAPAAAAAAKAPAAGKGGKK